MGLEPMISRVAASVSTRDFLGESTALAAWPPPQKVNPRDQHDLHSAIIYKKEVFLKMFCLRNLYKSAVIYCAYGPVA